MATASASSSKGTTATTGPKISSRKSAAGRVGRRHDRAREPEARARRDLAAVGHVDPIDVAGHLVAVRGGDERPHHGAVGQRVTDRDAGRRVDEPLDEAVEGRALDQHAAAGAAVLAGVVEHRVGRGRRGGVQVGVGEDDVGALAAQLQRDPLHLVGAAGHDPPAHRGRAGEADLADQSGCSTSRHPASAPVPTTTFEHALRQPGLEGQLGQAQRGERRQLGGLQHHRVAAGQRRAELPAGDQQREVPRRDQPDHAERLVEGHRHATGHRDGVAQVLVDRTGVVVEHVGHRADLATARGDRLADVGRLELRELLAVLLDRGRPAGGAAGPDPSGRRPATAGSARAARSTAASTSSGPASACSTSTSSVAGLRTARVSLTALGALRPAGGDQVGHGVAGVVDQPPGHEARRPP